MSAIQHFVLFLILSSACWAQEKQSSFFTFDFRTDLWTSIYHNKPTPIRVYELRLDQLIADKDNWGLHVLAHTQSLSTGRADIVVGRRRTRVGSDLRDQGIGARGNYVYANRDDLSGTVEYRSISDEPFRDRRDTWTEIDLRYRFLSQGPSHWFIWSNYSKDRGYLNDQVLVLPGYALAVSDTWLITYGLTFLTLDWERNPWGDLHLDLNPSSASLKLTNEMGQRIIFMAETGVHSKSYLHANRTEESLRLFIEESYLESAFQFKLSESTFLRLLTSYGFNRFLSEGKQAFLPTVNRSTMPSDLYGGIKLGRHF